MKTMLLTFCTAALIAAAALSAAAQQDRGGGPGPMMQEQREPTPEQFGDMKARVLKMIEDRMTRLEQEKACVEASTNNDELKKCRPERPMGMGPGGGFRGGLQEGPERQRSMR